MKSLKVIALDLDGTLLDSNHIKDNAFDEIFSEWPEWVHKGAIELLSLEDDYRLQNGALSFEDDSPFRHPETSFCQNAQNGSPEWR